MPTPTEPASPNGRRPVPPAFQFYAGDFLADGAVAEMTYEERGVYITLLCHAWLERGIPASQDRIARLLRMRRRELDQVWPALARCWVEGPADTLVNPRMETIRGELEEYIDHQRAAGRRGAEARWGKREEPAGA